MDKKRALISGCAGQDGSFMADLLLSMDYEVFGLIRRKAQGELGVAEHLQGSVQFIHGDVTDRTSVRKAIAISNPHEIYHFAAQSHVGESFQSPELTQQVNVDGTFNVMSEAWELSLLYSSVPPVRVYNACSSEMFGKVDRSKYLKQDELTPFVSRSPYGTSKIAQYWTGRNFRDLGLPVWNGITFNHESERRGPDFVTRKITMAVAGLSRHLVHVMGKEDPVLDPYITSGGDFTVLMLGNMDTIRDWGYAPDYCKAFHAMLQLDPPGDDFVVATGVNASVKDFLSLAFKSVDISNWKPYVGQDERFLRPSDVPYLCGDASKLTRATGWVPEISLPELATLMVKHDQALLDSTSRLM